MAIPFAPVARGTWETLRSRWRRGPAQPGWGFGAELGVTVFRHIIGASKKRGVHWLRDATQLPGFGPARRRVRFEPVDAGGVPALWCVPKEGPPPRRTLLFLHGGGYVIGSPEGHGDLIAAIAAEAGVRVLAPDYRLAPEHAFPAPQEDVFRAYRFLLGEGVEPASLAVGGDSAGGALTLATLLQARAAGEPPPAAAILICPWTDPAGRGGSLESHVASDYLDREVLYGWFRTALGDEDSTDPRWAGVNADLSGLPPLLVQSGGAEVLRDQIRVLVERARTAGVDVTAREWDGMFHDWMLFGPLVPQGAEAVAQMAEFLRKRLVG